MKWWFIVGALWYWWRVYTLSYRPQDFPNPAYALMMWRRRASRTALLGSLIATTALHSFGLLRSWWMIGLALVVGYPVMGLFQLALIQLIVYWKYLLIILKVRTGRRLGAPKLAPLVWPIYLTVEEGGRGDVFIREIAESYSQASATQTRKLVFSILLLWTFAEAWLTARDWHNNDAPWWLCIVGFLFAALIRLWVMAWIALAWDWTARWYARRRSAV